MMATLPADILPAMPLAIFDLDGTITRHDTLFPLVVRWLSRRPWRLAKLLRVVPGVVRYLFIRDRGALKQDLLRATLRGVPRAELLPFSANFVRDQIARGCFRDALTTIERHRNAGHRLVLMSASVDFYIPEFGRQLGFDQVISTEVAWQGDRLDGTLISANRRGEEKARCVRELLAAHDESETYAYGNSDSDLPHLKLVKHGLLVNGSVAARRRAAELGVSCVDWT
jgi:HAD superfamily hydrolase (TIGR01490 family)